MKLRSSRVLRRVTPRVDLQYHIGVPDPHDLDQPRYPLLGLHTTPGDRFYNLNPIVQSNPGSSRESSMEPIDTDEAQQITDRLTQGIRNSGRLRRSGSLWSVPSPLSAAVHFPHPQVGASPLLGVPTPNLGVAIGGGAPVALTPTNTGTLIPGEGTRLMPNGSTRRSMEGPSILNIPPYVSHDVRDDENPTLHRPKVVELPDIFQRPSGQGAHPKTLPQYSTRTMAEELGYATEGESHHMEVKMNFHLPLPRQPCLTDVCAWRAPTLTEQGNKAIYVQIDEWVNMYGTNIFVVDEITGRMYTKVGGKLHSIPEIASHWHQEEPAVMPRTDEQDQTSARERALGEELVQQAPTLGEHMGTVSPRIAETSPSVASRPQGTARMGIDAQGAATERRDRDSQLIGIIRPMASQPPMPHDVEEVQELDIEFDWENETIEQWAYAR